MVNDTIAAIQDSLSTWNDEATQRVVSSLLSSMALKLFQMAK
jgi:hypothetical protein